LERNTPYGVCDASARRMSSADGGPLAGATAVAPGSGDSRNPVMEGLSSRARAGASLDRGRTRRRRAMCRPPVAFPGVTGPDADGRKAEDGHAEAAAAEPPSSRPSVLAIDPAARRSRRAIRHDRQRLIRIRTPRHRHL
jgi:hypothetical protein